MKNLEILATIKLWTNYFLLIFCIVGFAIIELILTIIDFFERKNDADNKR